MDEKYKNILIQKRFYTSYFFVGKYGNGWEKEEGEYIYRGTIVEDHLSFAKRLKNFFQNTSAIIVDEKPKILNPQDKYLVISAVIPCNENLIKNINFKLNLNIHPKISKYYNENNVKYFYKERRYDLYRDKLTELKKKVPNNYNDMKNLFREILFFEVEETFPTVTRKQKIINTIQQIYTPLQSATRDLEDKIRDLTNLYILFTKEIKPDLKMMSMAMNGTLDAAVNGGISKYLSAFFNKRFISKADEQTINDLKRFQNTLVDQLNTLKLNLEIWKKFQTKSGLGLLTHLESRWKEMERQVLVIASNLLDPKLIQLDNNDKIDSDEEYLKN